MLLTVMFSESPATPGRNEHMPRVISEIDTPAFDVLDDRVIISVNVKAQQRQLKSALTVLGTVALA